MVFPSCRWCAKELPSDAANFPNCSDCKKPFHFDGCSGLNEAAWVKRSADRRANWTCHICDPDRNLSQSATGITVPPADPKDALGASNSLNETSSDSATLKRRRLEALGDSPPQVIPKFASLDAKCDYVLDMALQVMSQNKQVLEELRLFRVEADAIRETAKLQASKIEKLEETVTELRMQNRQLEDYSRADNVVLHGFPPAKSEKEAFKSLFAAASAVNVDIGYRDLNACHALRTADKNSGRVIARFCNRWLKNDFLRFVNKARLTSFDLGLPGENRPVFVTEHLSPESARLFAEVRNTLLQRNGGIYGYAWTRNRKIFVKESKKSTPIQIDTYAQLRVVQQQQSQRMDGVETVQ